MTPPRVPCLFPPPCRENALNAISRAILRIRSKGVSRGELAKLLGASVDVIDSASNEESLLNFTAIARIGLSASPATASGTPTASPSPCATTTARGSFAANGMMRRISSKFSIKKL